MGSTVLERGCLRKNEVIVWEGFRLVQSTEGVVLYVNI